MDEATLARLMGTYGAPVTANNANKAREFFASNPDYAERRANGMRGSIQEDNTDLLGPMLEKIVQETTGPAPAPAGNVEVGPIEKAPVQQAAPRQAPAAPVAAPNRQANYGMQDPPGAVNSLDPQVSNASPDQGKSYWNDILMSLLGLTSVAGVAAMNRAPKAVPRAVGEGGVLLENPYPNGQKRIGYQYKLTDQSPQKLLENPYPNEQKRIGYQYKLTDQSPPKMPSGAPELDQNGLNVERTKMLQPEIDAENQTLARSANLREQIRKQVLLKKAQGALGRR